MNATTSPADDIPGLLMPTTGARRRIRLERTPARFKDDRAAQLDVVKGSPELAVPAGHLARDVKKVVFGLDLSEWRQRYSSLGRQGYDPANVLAVLVYASLTNVHTATAIARLMRTDLAYLLLSGGYAYSDSTLRKFRSNNADLFRSGVSAHAPPAW